jgi:hypothetical protein
MNMKYKIVKSKNKTVKSIACVSFFLFTISYLLFPISSVFAAANNVPAVDLNSPGFHLLQCDGPAMPANLEQQQTAKIGHTYQPCNFQGLMIEIQYLLNVMTIVAVLAAIGGFAYAGYLYITGTQENLKKAKSMFPKIGIGFILILTAWFIVYQILAWLTGSAGAAALLGNGS